MEASPATATACSASSAYAGGVGTVGSPFQVATANQLIRLSTTSADWVGKYFIQTAEIDLNDCVWEPIMTDASRFSGSYDGAGFAVKGSRVVTFPKFMLNNGLFRAGGGGHDSTVFTRTASIGTNGQIVQPFYYDNVKSRWVKMTYGTAAFDFALGFGTGNEPSPSAPYDATKNWTGSTVFGTFQSPDPFQSPVAGTASVTAEDYSCVFETPGSVCMGTGAIVASADFVLGGRTVTVVNSYTLAPDSKFLEVTTSVENSDSSAVNNVNVWVGTRDDWAGIKNDGGDNAQPAFDNRYRADLPQKFRGTITDGVFQALSSSNEKASALVLESLDGAGLFFSTSPNVNATIAPCCEALQSFANATSSATGTNTARGFENAVTLNPAASAIATPLGAEAFKPGDSEADFFQNRRTDLRDAGYALHLPLASIAAGEIKSATWFLGGTAYSDSERTSLLVTVSEAADTLIAAAPPPEPTPTESSSPTPTESSSPTPTASSSPTPTESSSPTPTASSSPTPASTVATRSPLPVVPTSTLAVTGSNLLINWGFVSATILIGLTMVLISSVRRPETHEGKG
jgi:hypothetical protein